MHYEFVKKFIETRKAVAKVNKLHFKGVHSVISGFNNEFRTLFGSVGMTADELKQLPINAVNVLVVEGKLVVVPANRGVMIYLASDAPEVKPRLSADDIRRKYGLTPPPVIAPTVTSPATATI